MNSVWAVSIASAGCPTYALTFGGFLLFGGRAADLLGRRRLFMAGLAIFTAASLACALATVDVLADGTLTRYAGWPCIIFLNVPIGAARSHQRI